MGAYYVSWSELVDLVGFKTAVVLCENFGGREKYIPADSKRGDLRNLIGPERADILSSLHGGETLCFPNCVNNGTPRKVKILELLGAGELSVSQIAEKANVTVTWVKTLKRQYIRALEKQPTASRGV